MVENKKIDFISITQNINTKRRNPLVDPKVAKTNNNVGCQDIIQDGRVKKLPSLISRMM